VVIAAQTGISGSVIIEDDCVIGGQVGFGDHIHVQSGAIMVLRQVFYRARLYARSVGDTDQPLEEYKRLHAHIRRLPHVRQELKDLTEPSKILEAQLSHKEE